VNVAPALGLSLGPFLLIGNLYAYSKIRLKKENIKDQEIAYVMPSMFFKEKKRVGAIPEYGDSEFEVASAILVLDRPGIECGHLYIFTTYLSNISHVEQVSHSI
jgi:hypothetical protein